MNRSVRLLPLLLLLPLAGCEQTRPPTPEGIKKANARTGTGTKNTLLEVVTQPETLTRGGVTIVNYKVFQKKIDPDGRRNEWSRERGFIELSDAVRQNVSERLMRAWVVETHGGYMAAIAPNFKAYASFLSDFTPPRMGRYVMFVEYTPYETNASRKQVILPREQARKELYVGGSGNELKPLTITSAASRSATVFGPTGEATKDQVSVDNLKPKAGQELTLGWKPPSSAGQVDHPEIVAISPDNQKLLHFSGQRPKAKFPSPGNWRLWFTYQFQGEIYTAPYPLTVGK